MNRVWRDILIEHIDGPVPWRGPRERKNTARALLARGLLAGDISSAGWTGNIGATQITERGRAALAVALGDWADAITRVRLRADRFKERQEHPPAVAAE